MNSQRLLHTEADVVMWCYQKPGFEALLLAELQRQQQCSQFCDTLLKTEGVSVPAHSCILSAISPHISSALSTKPPSPAGHGRLLEFPALGGCTLLHMVSLMYCGEMAGEGEKQKQDAISAAAKLGIHGLVEVTKNRQMSRIDEGWQTTVGVPTESLMPEENEARMCRWRREVIDGNTVLWKETLSNGKKETWTQTEELPAKSGPPPHPADTFETIDITALQNLGQTHSHFVPPQIPYMPLSLLCQPDENLTLQHPSALMETMQESTASIVAPQCTFAPPCSSQANLFAADLHSCWAEPQVASTDFTAAEDLLDKQLEQFQGNIPGYISYFLNLREEKQCGRGRARRRQGTGGARSAGTAERRPQRPRARTAGRGRGKLTQTVDMQEVGVSKLQKLFLQRWGPSRVGQGGGAVGRKMHLKTRELVMSAKSRRRRRGHSKGLDFSDGGRGHTQRGRSRTQDALPPQEEQPEHFDRLLEEVMMGLNILPKTTNNSGTPSSQPALLATNNTCTSLVNTLAENKQHSRSAGLQDASVCFLGSTQVVAKARRSSSSSEMPVLQQQGEGELYDMLDHYLQSFEQRVDSCAAEEELAMAGQSATEVSQTHASTRKDRKNKTKTTRPPQVENTPCPASRSLVTQVQRNKTPQIAPRSSQQLSASALSASALSASALSASALSAATPQHTEGSPERDRAPKKKRKRKRKNEYLLSLEKKKRKRMSLSDRKKLIHELREEQLRQMPVVKLKRLGQLPATVPLQTCSCLEVKSLAKAKSSSSSSVKHPRDPWSSKMYPIRKRFREAHITDNVPLVEEPLHITGPSQKGCSKVGPDINGLQTPNLPDCESSVPPTLPQPVTELTLQSPGSVEEDKDEDVDVVSGCSPLPEVVVINWTESSEADGEEGDEEVDVDGVSPASITLGKSELFAQTSQIGVLLR